MDPLKNLNLIKLLGSIPRNNKNYKGYSENPEFFDKAGKAGIKFRNIPDFIPNQRSFVIGNTVFQNEGEINKWKHAKTFRPDLPENMWTEFAKEEIPHVGQYREHGLLVFIGRYIGELAENKFSQKSMYHDKHSLEGFHYDREERDRLVNEILGKIK